MKKSMLFIALALNFGAFAGNKSQNDSTVCYKVSMDCIGCKIKIEKNIAFEKGVKALDINLDEKIVKVKFNANKNNSQALKAAIEKLQYKVEILADCN